MKITGIDSLFFLPSVINAGRQASTVVCAGRVCVDYSNCEENCYILE